MGGTSGEEKSFLRRRIFLPLHTRHVYEEHPELTKLLGLAPGYRFLVADLQLGGKDAVGNMKPIDKSVNRGFQSCCDGVWEHSFGIKIETTDNPGWVVTIDLTGTKFCSSPRSIRNCQNAEDDWMICQVDDNNQFVGGGDPQKLPAILGEFARFRRAQGKD